MKSNICRWLPLAATALLLSCSSGQTELQKQVESSNKNLPEDIGYGMTLEHLAYADSTVSAYINLNGPELKLSTIRLNADRLRYDYIDYMHQAPDTTELGYTVSLIKEEKASLLLLFCADADTVRILIPADEI